MKNGNSQKTKIFFFSTVTTLLLLLDIYIIGNRPKDYIILGVAVFGTLIGLYLTISSFIQMREREAASQEEQYNQLMESEKASFLLLKKKFFEMEQRMGLLEKKMAPLEKSNEETRNRIASMLDSLMIDQKKIAKITVSQSKENATALMNSNDKLLNDMSEFQQAFHNLEAELLKKQNELMQQQMQEMEEIREAMDNSFRNLEKSLTNKVEGILENAVKASPVSTVVPELSQMAAAPEMEIAAEPMPEVIPEAEPVLEAVSEPEIVMEPELEAVPETEIIPEPEPEVVPETEIIPGLEAADPNKPMSPEDIEALLSSIGSEPENVPEPEAVPEPIPEVVPEAADPNKPMSPEDIEALLSSIGSEPEAEPENVPEPEAVPEPIPENVPEAKAQQDMSNPNKMMTPEDIAALIANTASEELPETTKKMEVEEKPPMPDTSDPNKVMSPEDIAALIANM